MSQGILVFVIRFGCTAILFEKVWFEKERISDLMCSMVLNKVFQLAHMDMSQLSKLYAAAPHSYEIERAFALHFEIGYGFERDIFQMHTITGQKYVQFGPASCMPSVGNVLEGKPPHADINDLAQSIDMIFHQSKRTLSGIETFMLPSFNRRLSVHFNVLPLL